MKTNLISALLIVAFSIGINAHVLASGPLFSQSFSNPLSLNPAYAGSLGCSRLGLNYRNILPIRYGNYYTSGTSYDQFVPKLHGGIGISYNYETFGNVYSGQTIDAMYAFNFKIKKLIIRPAINVGYEYEKYFPLTFINGSTTYYYPGETNNNFNLGLGVLFARKNLIFGASYNHINDKKSELIHSQYSNPRLTLHGNYLWKPTENISIMPGIVYTDEGMNSLASTSLLFKYKFIKIGTAYKSYYWGSEELVGMIGIVNDVISIGYSYDFSLSKLASSSGGAHEFSVVINFNCKNDKEKYGISQLYEF